MYSAPTTWSAYWPATLSIFNWFSRPVSSVASAADFESCASAATGVSRSATIVAGPTKRRTASITMPPWKIRGLIRPLWVRRQRRCSTDEQRVFVVGRRRARPRSAARRPTRGKKRADHLQQAEAFTRRRKNALLERLQRLLDAPRRRVDPIEHHVKRLLKSFDLRTRGRRGSCRIRRHRLQAGDDRPDLLFETRHRLADAAGGTRREYDGHDLDDRHHQDGDRDQSQEDVVHASCSPPGVPWNCWRVRSNAVVMLSRCLFNSSRPCFAASAARSRPSRARCPRYSRVSSPVAGANSSATAAPTAAPAMKATRMPAPLSLFAMMCLS